MEESRKAYEAWFKSRYGSLSIPPKQRLVMRTYSWAVWQASRAAIEIKLDDKVMVEDEFDKGHNCAIDYCAEAIRAAGIKVKE